MRIKTCLLIVVSAVLLVACSKAGPPTEPAADYVFSNGNVYTVNPDQEWAQAVAVSGKTIVYVGDNDGAKAFVGEGTESIDLQQRLVLPGFVESHIHVAGGAATSSGLIVSTADSIEDIQKKIKDYAAANPDKETIFAGSYLSTLFGPDGPTKELLDVVVSDRPVFLLDHTGHAAWANTKALEVAGVNRDTPDPDGGEYIRTADGEISGALRSLPAFLPVLLGTNAITAESLMAVLPNVFEGMSEFGFTSAMDMGMPFATEESYQAFVNLDNAGDLPIRLSVTHYVNTAARADDPAGKIADFSSRFTSEHVWFDTLKILGDGVVQNQKAALLEPYLTTGDLGALSFEPEILKEMALEVAAKGYNITIHTVGDRANRVALDTAQAVREAGYTDTLFSTTHTEMSDPSDRSRWAELDVTVQTAGNFAVPIAEYVEVIGQERIDTLQFPFRTFADSGANIALGADWPATPGGFEFGVNPFINMHNAMHRHAPLELQAALGTFDSTLRPYNEVLTVAEAVAAYTIGGARMLGIDDDVGTIEVGKKADIILLDQNLFEIDPASIYKTKVLATMFDGRIVHDVVYDLGDDELVEMEVLDVTLERPIF